MNLKLYDNIDGGYMKDYVYQILRKNIMELRLKPGINLRKEDIAKELEVSITPVREAFTKLAEDGLINVYPQSGTYVSHINLEKVEQAKFMREHLEKAVVRLACKNFSKDSLFKIKANVKMQEIYAKENNYIQLFELDNDFHLILFEGCNKKDLWTAIQHVSSHLDRVRVLSLTEDVNRNKIIGEHQDIINAINEQNEELAEKLMLKHLAHFKFDIDEIETKYLNLFK